MLRTTLAGQIFETQYSTVAIRKAESPSQAVGPVDMKYQSTAEEL